MNWLGLDIGGANLKAADGNGYATSYGFELWRDSERLARELRMLIAEAPPCERIAVTMTGELADCFSGRAEGVRFIISAVEEAADGRHTRVYLHDGRFVAPLAANRTPELAAASNWQALSRFAGRYAPEGPALLLDVGSTTCDIVPLLDGLPKPKGVTDLQRLLNGELLYTGVERSPVCGVVHEVVYRGRACPVADELFATMRDIYILLGDLPEQPGDNNTADGKAATKGGSRLRVGRMICASDLEFNHRDAVHLAQAAANAQRDQLSTAVQQVVADLPKPPEQCILSGHGEFLARRVLADCKLDVPTRSLIRELGPAVARAATAHAVAVLAREAAEG